MYFAFYLKEKTDPLQLILEEGSENKTYILHEASAKGFIRFGALIPTSWMQGRHYHRFSYRVVQNNQTFYTGSFPLIRPEYEGQLAFGFASCNDNVSQKDLPWHTYAAQGKTSMWQAMSERKLDVLVQHGDQIYADSIFALWNAQQIRDDEIESYYHQLFSRSYAQEFQGKCMRNALVYSVIDDHDVTNNFGNTFGLDTFQIQEYQKWHKKLPKDPKKPLHFSNEAFEAYHQKVLPILAKYENISWIEEQPGKFYGNAVVDLGKYRLILADTRHALYYDNQAYNDVVFQHVKSALEKPSSHKKPYILVILPRPLMNYGPLSASLMEKNYGDGLDESFHPNNAKRARAFQKMLLKSNQEIKIISGDIHECCIQNHCSKRSTVSEMITSGVSRIPLQEEGFMAQIQLSLLDTLSWKRRYGVKKRTKKNRESNIGFFIQDQFELRTASQYLKAQ